MSKKQPDCKDCAHNGGKCQDCGCAVSGDICTCENRQFAHCVLERSGDGVCKPSGNLFTAKPVTKPARKPKAQLKLFVWTGFSPDYTSGLAFAIAENEDEARKLIEERRGCEVYEWGTLEVHPVNRRIARSVSGGG